MREVTRNTEEKHTAGGRERLQDKQQRERDFVTCTDVSALLCFGDTNTLTSQVTPKSVSSEPQTVQQVTMTRPQFNKNLTRLIAYRHASGSIRSYYGTVVSVSKLIYS